MWNTGVYYGILSGGIVNQEIRHKKAMRITNVQKKIKKQKQNKNNTVVYQAPFALCPYICMINRLNVTTPGCTVIGLEQQLTGHYSCSIETSHCAHTLSNSYR